MNCIFATPGAAPLSTCGNFTPLPEEKSAFISGIGAEGIADSKPKTAETDASFFAVQRMPIHQGVVRIVRKSKPPTAPQSKPKPKPKPKSKPKISPLPRKSTEPRVRKPRLVDASTQSQDGIWPGHCMRGLNAIAIPENHRRIAGKVSIHMEDLINQEDKSVESISDDGMLVQPLYKHNY